MSEKNEFQLRMHGGQLLAQAGLLLKIPITTTVTSQVIFQRFYCKNSFQEHDYREICMGALFLACKVEETVRKNWDVAAAFINVFKKYEDNQIQFQFRDLNQKIWKSIVDKERIILKEVGFELFRISDHPHKFIASYFNFLKCSKTLAQKIWGFLNDVYLTSACVHFPPQQIAAACIYLGMRVTQHAMPKQPWWPLLEASFAHIQEICASILMLYDFKERVTFKKARAILPDFRESFIDLSFLHMRREYMSLVAVDNIETALENNNNNNTAHQNQSHSKGYSSNLYNQITRAHQRRRTVARRRSTRKIKSISRKKDLAEHQSQHRSRSRDNDKKSKKKKHKDEKHTDHKHNNKNKKKHQEEEEKKKPEKKSRFSSMEAEKPLPESQPYQNPNPQYQQPPAAVQQSILQQQQLQQQQLSQQQTQQNKFDKKSEIAKLKSFMNVNMMKQMPETKRVPVTSAHQLEVSLPQPTPPLVRAITPPQTQTQVLHKVTSSNSKDEKEEKDEDNKLEELKRKTHSQFLPKKMPSQAIPAILAIPKHDYIIIQSHKIKKNMINTHTIDVLMPDSYLSFVCLLYHLCDNHLIKTYNHHTHTTIPNQIPLQLINFHYSKKVLLILDTFGKS